MDRGAWQAAVHGVSKSRTRLSDFTFTFHFRALEKEMATHSSVLAWRIPGMGEPGGLPSMGSHRSDTTEAIQQQQQQQQDFNNSLAYSLSKKQILCKSSTEKKIPEFLLVLSWDSTAYKLGIGTFNPSQSFHFWTQESPAVTGVILFL